MADETNTQPDAPEPDESQQPTPNDIGKEAGGQEPDWKAKRFGSTNHVLWISRQFLRNHNAEILKMHRQLRRLLRPAPEVCAPKNAPCSVSQDQ